MSVSETTNPTTGSSGLILDSLEVKNFRAFRHLTIEKLGRVNLITGKNNVGKSSLLEALWIYARRGHPIVFRSILTNRRESKFDLSSVTVDSNLSSLPYQATLEDYGFLSLFSTRPKLLDDDLWFSVGSFNDRDDSVVVTLSENQSSFDVNAWVTVRFFDDETTYPLDDLSAVPARSRTRSTSLLNLSLELINFTADLHCRD